MKFLKCLFIAYLLKLFQLGLVGLVHTIIQVYLVPANDYSFYFWITSYFMFFLIYMLFICPIWSVLFSTIVFFLRRQKGPSLEEMVKVSVMFVFVEGIFLGHFNAIVDCFSPISIKSEYNKSDIMELSNCILVILILCIDLLTGIFYGLVYYKLYKAIDK
jgi:hypothetical protein